MDGLENRLAELLASDLGRKVEFVWWEQRRDFIDHTLGSGACDAIMGVPATLGDYPITRPYYTSSYVWVQKAGREPRIASLYDDRLKTLRIGVHVVDDSYAPPAQVLASRGLAANLVAFSLYGSAAEANPPARLIDAVRHGDVDAALAWGPLAGYFAAPSSGEPALEITPVTPSRFGPVPFVYGIAVGVRKDQKPLRDQLDSAIVHQCAEVDALLKEYRIPQVGERSVSCDSAQSAPRSSLRR